MVDDGLLSVNDYMEAKDMEHLRDLYSENVGEKEFSMFVDSEVRVLERPSRKDFDEKPDGEIYLAARRDWWNMMGSGSEIILDGGLPGYDVSMDGREFKVRGYLHGDDKRSLYSLCKEGKEFFRRTVKEYNDDGEVFLEENLRQHLCSEKCIDEMDDVSTFFPKSVSESDGGLRSYGVKISGWIDLARNFLLKKFGEGTGVIEFEKTSKVLNALDDREEWGEALEVIRASSPPLRIEEDYLMNNMFYQHLLDTGRSVYQAEYALEKSEASHVYIVSGMGHVPHIKDFLELKTTMED